MSAVREDVPPAPFMLTKQLLRPIGYPGTA